VPRDRLRFAWADENLEGPVEDYLGAPFVAQLAVIDGDAGRMQDLECPADWASLLWHLHDLPVDLFQQDHSLVVEYFEYGAELRSWSVFWRNSLREFLAEPHDLLLGAGALSPAVTSVLLAFKFSRVPLLAKGQRWPRGPWL
jgi:hypothetical protein